MMEVDLSLPPKLVPHARPKRFKIAIGGRGSGKSIAFARFAIMYMLVGKTILGCREFQNSISDSVHNLIIGEIEALGLEDYFTIQATEIISDAGGRIFYKGLSRNPQSIKSLSGIDVCWVEEAQTISEESLRLLMPTIREAGSELWFTANPQSKADPFSQRFINPYQRQIDSVGEYSDDLHLISKVNYDDNPWFPSELEQQREYDLLNEPTAVYRHVWLGEFLEYVDNAIINMTWFDAAIDAHKTLGFKAKGAKIVSHDPSDLGKDAKGLAYRQGSIIHDVQFYDGCDVNDGCDIATDYALKHKADIFTFDTDGIGASLRRQINASFYNIDTDILEFRGGGQVQNPDSIYEKYPDSKMNQRTNRDTFKNLRAQAYWMLRDRFYKTYRAIEYNEYYDPEELISLSSDIKDIDALRSEVCRIPRVPNGAGLIQIASKEQMKKQGIESPNMADALMMSMIVSKPKKKIQRINFQSPFGY